MDNIYNTSSAIQIESPNSYLYSFDGILHLLRGDNFSSKLPLTVENLLLRGSKLKNTDYIIGAVAYTGHETKVNKASKKYYTFVYSLIYIF